MIRGTRHPLSWPTILGLIACGGAFAPALAHAQDGDAQTAGGDYRNEEPARLNSEEVQSAPDSGPNTNQGDQNNQSADQTASQGVVRLARFTQVRGNVTWRADEGGDWSQATTNLPLRQSAQVWVTDGGRAEIQFDDGSILRLGNGALVTLKTLYSDQDGEFTQITLNEGLVSLRAKHDHGVYRLDTPLISVTARGPARMRLGVGDGVEVAVREGEASIEGNLGKSTLRTGDYLDLANANTAYDPRPLPREDDWDKWNDERDNALDTDSRRPSHEYLPANISIVANNLDDYGTWHDDGEYGHVWCPRVEDAGWRPYYHGHWTWVNPFGWTWVSDEAWGWAPYHYGTWISRPYGWAWVPGPVNQYWSPAVVNFCEYDRRVAWVALAPREVRYPPVLAVGFRSGNWSAFFAIGGAAVYYPTVNNYCVARPFNTGYVNHVTYINNTTIINNRFGNSAEFYAANRNTYLQNNRFVPYNARTAAGVTVAASTGFGTRTAFQAMPRSSNAAFFAQGRIVGAPPVGARPVAGPQAVPVTRESLTPLHSFAATARPSAAALNRSVFRAPLPATVARRAVQIAPSGEVIRTPGRTAGTVGANGLNTGRNATPGAIGSRSQPSTSQPSTSTGSTGRVYTPNGGLSTGRTARGANGTPNSSVTGHAGQGTTGSAARNNPTTGGTSAQTGIRPNGSDRTVHSANRVFGANRPGTSTGNISAAEEARRARASLGMPSGRAQTGGGTGTSNGRSYEGRASTSAPSGTTNRANTGSYDGRANRTGSSSDAGTGSNRTRTYEPRQSTSSPRSGSENTAPRQYTPRSGGDSAPTHQYAPPPPRQYTPPPSAPRQNTPPPPRERSSESAPRENRSSGDSKDKDKKGKN
jgi:FecR protein